MQGTELMRIELDELSTLIIAILTLFLGRWLRQSIPVLRRLDIPNAVVGAAVVAVLVLLGQLYLNIDIAFGSQLRSALLLVVFTTIGLSAKLPALRAGGKPLVLLCLVTVVMLAVQNATGALSAVIWGAHPAYGVLAGALSFVGGPGTAMAWASHLEGEGLQGAAVVGIGASTLATVAGALIAGPFAGWVIRRHQLKSAAQAPLAPGALPMQAAETTTDQYLLILLIVAASVFLGEQLNLLAAAAGLMLPGFLTAMLVGVAITNLADVVKLKINFAAVEMGGSVSLQLFLVIALMATPLISVAQIIVPLMLNVALQVIATAAIAYFLLFRLLGRDYDAAVTLGGFMGFGLASMPVAMGTMDEVAKRYGPAPKAILLITLAGSFFVDLSNAFVAKVFLSLPGFEILPTP